MLHLVDYPPKPYIGTAELLSKVDKIFDCCNSLSFRDGKICRRPLTSSSPHLHEIEGGITFSKSSRVINRVTAEDRTSQLKCLRGWCITLKAISQLWHTLHSEYQVAFLVTRQLNQDPLENFFGSIRQQGGNSDNPTPIQVRRAYRKLFHTNLLTVASSNCEQDDDVPLATLADLEELPDLSQPEVGPLRIIATDYSSEHLDSKIFTDNAIAYVVGYLLRKTYGKHFCTECSTLTNNNAVSDKTAFLAFKAYESSSSMYSGLIVPSDSMLLYVNQLKMHLFYFSVI